MDKEVSKYLKKKDSSKSLAKVKSDHKHIYVDVLLLADDTDKVHKAKYCKLCGKINDVEYFLSEKKSGYYHVLSSEEILARYSTLERRRVSSLDQKYLTI